jgi:hypothetical protein
MYDFLRQPISLVIVSFLISNILVSLIGQIFFPSPLLSVLINFVTFILVTFLYLIFTKMYLRPGFKHYASLYLVLLSLIPTILFEMYNLFFNKPESSLLQVAAGMGKEVSLGGLVISATIGILTIIVIGLFAYTFFYAVLSLSNWLAAKINTMREK